MTKRSFDEMKVFLQKLSHEDMIQLKALLHRHGSTVSKLQLTIAGSAKITENNLIEILNFFPILTDLKLKVWEKSLFLENARTEDFLRLFSLRKLNFFGSLRVLVIFTNLLPRHVLNDLTYSGNQQCSDTWYSFISTQLAIKKLNLDGCFTSAVPFTKLQLTHLKITFRDQYSTDNLSFMKSFIFSQTNLTDVDVRCNTRTNTWKINEKVISTFSLLLNLETFKLNIDHIKAWKIQFLSNFPKLKKLEIYACHEKSLATIAKLSLINNLGAENLKLHTMNHEVSCNVFKQLSRNFMNLKSLEISFIEKHKINFFIIHFPNLESLKLTYGNETNVISLADVFDSGENDHRKLKSLSLRFYDVKVVSKNLFFDLRFSFMELEKFEFHSKLPLSRSFLIILHASLAKIKSLKMSHFKVENKFVDKDLVDCLITLRLKLKFVELTLRNVQNFSRSSVPIRGHLRQESCEERDPNFSYQSLANALTTYYKFKIVKIGQNKLYRELILTASPQKLM